MTHGPVGTMSPVRVLFDGDGKVICYVPSRSSAPGAHWPVTAEIVTPASGVPRLETHCPCPSPLTYCWHLRQVCEQLERQGVLERTGNGWAPPLPPEDGDAAKVADFLAHANRRAAGVR